MFNFWKANKILFYEIWFKNDLILITNTYPVWLYLEVGHTLMAADALHGNISQKIKEEKYIFSAIHLISNVQNSRKDVFVKCLTFRDILIFENNYNNKKAFAISNDERVRCSCSAKSKCSVLVFSRYSSTEHVPSTES